jgi:hypothetical protein
MLFILGVTLAAVLVIGLGALGALSLLLHARLRAAQEEVEALRARLAAPTVWEGLGAEWSEAQALTAAIATRPLASAILPSPDFAAPRAWLLDPPEPGSPAEAQPAPGFAVSSKRRGAGVTRSLNGEDVQSSLFPAWTADAGLGRTEKAESVPVPGAAIGVALLGVYALAAAAGALFAWPWLATMAVLAVLGGLMAAGFWRSDRSLGVSFGVGMAGVAPWVGAMVGAPASVVLPCAGAVAAAGALWAIGRRAPALTWTAAVLTLLGAVAGAALVSGGVWALTPALSGALALGLLSLLGLIKARTAGEAALRRPASALHAAGLTGLAGAALTAGAAGPFGVALAVAVAATAAFAHGRGRDAALVCAWFAGSFGLYALSGTLPAHVAMTPAATLMGAVFFAAAAARAPAPEQHGVVPFALAAAGVLTAALIADIGASGYALAALALALLFASGAQARGGAHGADWRFWPLAIAAAIALAQALTLAAPPALAAALSGLCALCLCVLAARARAGALGAAAATLAAFAAFSALEAASLTPLRADAWAGAAATAGALFTGAWVAGARDLGPLKLSGAAPATSLVVGAIGLGVALAAPGLAALAGPNRFGVIGAVGGLWLLTALLVRTGGEDDGFARAMSGPLALLGFGLALWAWFGPANPWLGAGAAPLPAGGAQAALAAGGLFPAAAAGAMAWRVGVEGKPRLGFGLACLAGLGALIWSALALRVATHGPAGLQDASFTPVEMLGLTVVLAIAGAALIVIGRNSQRLAARRAGLALVGVAAIKLAALDLHAAGLAPALVATTLALLMLAGMIAQRDRLAAAWRG